MVDFVCVVEVECFLGEVGGVGWRRGFGFWVLINVVSESNRVIGGGIERDLLFRVFPVFFLCSCVQFDLIS